MLDRESRRQFVRENTFCIWGYNRREHGPAMTPGYYSLEGDDICYLTMAERAKAKAARRDPRASACILDMKRPPSYLQVFGTVRVVTDLDFVYDVLLRAMRAEMEYEGNTYTDEDAARARDATLALIEEEERVVLRLTPESTFSSPPTRGENIEEKWKFRQSLGEVEEGAIRVGLSMPW